MLCVTTPNEVDVSFTVCRHGYHAFVHLASVNDADSVGNHYLCRLDLIGWEDQGRTKDHENSQENAVRFRSVSHLGTPTVGHLDTGSTTT